MSYKEKEIFEIKVNERELKSKETEEMLIIIEQVTLFWEKSLTIIN